MGNHVLIKKHSDISEILGASKYMVDPGCSNSTWSRRKDIVHNCKIVNSKVPDNINVTLEQAEVDACGIVVEDVSQLPRVRDGFDFAHCTGVYKSVIHQKRQVATSGFVNQVESLLRRRCHRLFYHDMLAALQCMQSE